MNEFKPNLSFEFKNSKSLFDNLLEEYDDFKLNDTKSRYAINCAINSWHLTDWTYQEYFISDPRFQDHQKEDSTGCVKVISGLLKYQNYQKTECSQLEFMRLITNGTKHCILNDKSQSAKTHLHEGVFSNAFSRAFDVSRFIIIDDGKILDFHDTLIATIDHWRAFFRKENLL